MIDIGLCFKDTLIVFLQIPMLLLFLEYGKSNWKQKLLLPRYMTFDLSQFQFIMDFVL